MSKRKRIQEFFSGKSVFITGSTGFLGKALLEKLIRSFEDLDKVFLLIRETPDCPASVRLEKILASELFDSLRASSPAVFDKLVPVSGDISLPDFGEKQEEEEEETKTEERERKALFAEIREKVSVIFHCAATVNFKEPLKSALKTNVSSVQHLLSFSRSLPHLCALVHVSTAFCHCDVPQIEEKYYDPVIDPLLLAQIVETMDKEVCSRLTDSLLGKKPNTYILTKALAEEVVRREGAGLPVAVVRPSMVTGMYHGPIPGWTDTLNGPGGLYLAVAHHLLKAFPGDYSNAFDMIPVDYCVNMMVSVAWKLGTSPSPPQSPPPILNCNSSTLNPIILKDHSRFLMRGLTLDPVKKPNLVQSPSLTLCKSKNMYYLFDTIQHRIPARVHNSFCKIRGKEPRLEKIWDRLYSVIDAYSFFVNGTWTWENSNSLALLAEMDPQDKEIFDFDVRHIDWEEYIPSYYSACKRFALAKEKERENRKLQDEAKPKEKEREKNQEIS